MRRLLSILLVLCMFMSLAPSVGAVAETGTIDVALTGAENFAALLAEQINAASAGDTIRLTGSCGEVTLTDSISITKGVTVDASAVNDGKGITVKSNSCSAFTVSELGAAETVTLRGIAFKSCDSGSGNGGAVSSLNANVTIEQCSFEECKGTDGGAVYAKWEGNTDLGSHLAIIDASFNGNSAANGGAIYTDGVGLSMTDVELVGNSTTGSGGAVNVRSGGYTNVKIGMTQCLIADNTANKGGGVFATGDWTPTLTFTNCTLTGNSAATDGGAVSLYTTAKAIFNNCIVADNKLVADENNVYLKGSTASAVYSHCVLGDISADDATTNSVAWDSDKVLFADSENGDFSLAKGSIAIDRADAVLLDATVTTDLAGNARINNDRLDIGCYEYFESTGEHTHTWSFSSEGNTLKAYCTGSDGCEYEGAAKAVSYSIIGSENTYDGTAHGVTVNSTDWIGAGCTEPVVTYYDGKGLTAVDGVPVHAGSYTAKAVFTSGETSLTAVATVKINKASQAAPAELTSSATSYSGLKDGVISGVSSDMEYKLSGEGSYTAVGENTSIVGLSAGKYLVRYEASADYEASPVTEVTVAAGPVDSNAPVISGITDGEIRSTTVKFSVSDYESGIAEVKVNGNAVDSYTLAGDADTTYTVCVTDRCGNSAECTVNMQSFNTLLADIAGFTVGNVTSAAKAALETAKTTLSGLDVTYAAEAEKTRITGELSDINNMLTVITTVDEKLQYIASLTDRLNTEKVTADNSADISTAEAYITALQNIHKNNLTEDEGTAVADAAVTVAALKKTVSDVAQQLTDLSTAASAYTEASLKYSDVTGIESCIASCGEVNTDNLTAAQKTTLDGIKSRLLSLRNLLTAENDSYTAFAAAVAEYDIDTVTAADTSAIEELKSTGTEIKPERLTEAQQSGLTALLAQLTALTERIADVAQQLTDLSTAASAYTEASLKYSDVTGIESCIASCGEVNTNNLTAAQKTTLDGIKSGLVGLRNLLTAENATYTDFAAAVAEYDIDKVTAADTSAIEELKSTGKEIKPERLTEAQQSGLTALMAQLTALTERIADVAKQLTDLSTAASAYTEASLKYSDVTGIESCIASCGEVNTDNLTAAQKTTLDGIKSGLLSLRNLLTAENDSYTAFAASVAEYDIDKVTAADTSAIENLKSTGTAIKPERLTEAQQSGLTALMAQLMALTERIADVAQQLTDLSTAASAYTEACLKYSDVTGIESCIASCGEVNTDNLTAAQKTTLDGIKSGLLSLRNLLTAENDSYTAFAAAVAEYDIDTVTAADTAAIENLKSTGTAIKPERLTEAQQSGLTALMAKLTALTERIADVAQQLTDLSTAASAYTEASLKYSDVTGIESCIASCGEVNTDNLTAEQKTTLDGINSELVGLRNLLTAENDSYTAFAAAVAEYDIDKVTAADTAAIEELKSTGTAIKPERLTEAQQSGLTALLAQLTALTERIAELSEQVITEKAAAVESQAEALPELEKLTYKDESAVSNFIAEYEALSDAEKEQLGEEFAETVQKLQTEMKEVHRRSYEPQIVEGGEQSIDLNDTTAEVSFRSEAEIEEFVEVRIDGKTVDRENYDVVEGSTIIVFKPEFLKSLGEGRHEISIVSVNGTAEAPFAVVPVKEAEPAKEKTEEEKKDEAEEEVKVIPEEKTYSTGDNGLVYLWFVLAVLSAFCALYTLKRRRRS